VVDDVESLLELLGVEWLCYRWNYLGLPLGAPYKSTSIFLVSLLLFETTLSKKWRGGWLVGSCYICLREVG
jgi:hypothetical protein